MNKTKIIGLSILLITLFSTSCFAKTDELKIHNEERTIPVEQVEEYKNNLEKEITIENVNYKLKDIKEQENKKTLTQDKEIKEQKVVKTNDKYSILKVFDSKKEIQENEFTGILELQNNSLDLKVNDSYIEQYKVTLKKEYRNVASNELNDVPKVIEQNGTTYYLVNPVWEIAEVQTIDGQDIPTTYNGVMNYEGIKERRIITSYIATVTYNGTLKKEVVESVTLNISYEEMPIEETNYIPVIATTTAGIIIFSGIVIFRRKNIFVYNFQNNQCKLVKKLYISKNKRLIDITPLRPMPSKYKIVMNNKIFNELIGKNVTIKYFDKQFIYEVKDQEFEIFV